MRLADLLGFALSALCQQKLRTLLTTLGVAFGCFVLVFSLSMGQGVQATILREYSRFTELRRIGVHPTYEPRPEETTEVVGDMSAEKRERIRREITRWEPSDREPTVRVRLTPEIQQRLREIPHVKSVVPVVGFQGRATFHNRTEEVSVHSARPDQPRLRDRIVAGEFLRTTEGDVAVVSEYLLYRLGIVDDAAVQGVLGQTLRLEYRTGTSKPNLLLTMLGAGRPKVAVAEQDLLDKVARQLPAALEQLDLTPAEKALLRQVLRPLRPAKPAPAEVTVTRALTIIGVLRTASEDDPRLRYEWWTDRVEVMLPVQTAADLFFEVPAHRASGLYSMQVEVDSLDHIKPVNAEIKALGLGTDYLLELIEREQFTYLLLFGVMNSVAAVALLVAALGIINTMLMAVLERTHEIGVMKAVGARNRHVQAIFLVEGGLIGLTGGLLGLFAGWAVSFLGDAWVRSLVATRLEIKLEESLFVWPAWLLAGSPLFAALVTTLAAVYPARRAARVDPITALRHP